jgi:hypothetical protein
VVAKLQLVATAFWRDRVIGMIDQAHSGLEFRLRLSVDLLECNNAWPRRELLDFDPTLGAYVPPFVPSSRVIF